MTTDLRNSTVSQSLYERERQARLEAERQLEEKNREILTINQHLTAEAEAVRAALADTEAVRLREAEALKERQILSEALKALTGKSGADEALQALLDVLKREIGGRDCFFVQAKAERVVISLCADRQHTGSALPLPVTLLDRARRLAKIPAPVAGIDWPGEGNEIASILIVPLDLPDENTGAIVLGCEAKGRYSSHELRTLGQVASLAAQALLALREARRNALLVSLIEGNPLDDKDSVLDASLAALHRDFARQTEMQGQIVGLLDSLLSAPLHGIDAAIDAVLARLGTLTGTDRVYVFRMRPMTDLIDNTHEWCGVGVSPARDILQGIEIEKIAHWRAAFDAGQTVVILDVSALPETAPEKATLVLQGIKSLLAVPMYEDGAFQGFVGLDAVRALRAFLPGEVHLIRSVAKVIVSVLARRDAEKKLTQAHAETVSQRTRLQAVLSAMPDLVVELDREGRFLSWHSGAIDIPEDTFAAYVNRTPEERLTPDLAAVLREKLRELDQGARIVSHTFEFTGRGPLTGWWHMSGSSLGEDGYLLALRDISQERQKNEEIERLSEIARRTTNLVVLTDANRRIEWVNNAFEQTTGYQLHEVIGKSPGALLQNDKTDPATLAKLRTALDKAEPIQVELLNQSRTGREYWLSIEIQPLHDQDGALEGFLAIEVDITEKREQAETLRRAAAEAAAARETLEQAVEALRDGFVLYDAEDRLVICNSRFRQLYGRCAPAIVPGAKFESILRYGLEVGQIPAASGREEAWLKERIAQHRRSDCEFEQVLPDGTWVRVFEKAMPDGGCVGLRVDITELKQAEQRARADRSAAMEASLDGIAITDADGVFVYSNRAHLEMFGYSETEELIGQPWSMLYRAEEVKWMETHAMPTLAQDGGWTGEVMGLAKDGSPVDQDVALTRNADGGLLCITRDISARRKERRERERLIHELQLAQRREMIGQMAAGLAHDFNNLLAIISGGASLILEAAEEPGPMVTGASRVLAASDQAAGLVKRLLTLGARQTERVPLDLRRPVQEASELVRSSLRARVRLSIDLPEAPVEAVADPTDMLQLVLNLAINARDAFGDTSGTISISLAPPECIPNPPPMTVGWIDGKRRYARLRVQDDGPGMPPDIASLILTPYFSTKGDKGTGLGLAVVSSVIEDNAGALLLQTEAGVGTIFDIYWPVDFVEAATPDQEILAQATGRLDGRMVLVVDDQPEVLDVVTAYLEGAGAEVAASTDPSDALEALQDDPDAWDLLVTDYDMPSMTGAKLAEAVKTLAPDVPIILVTALAGEAGRSGDLFSAVLSKPIDRSALVLQSELALLSVGKDMG